MTSYDVEIHAAADKITMSSREIAELCEKQHQHVRRDIETMCAGLEINPSSFGRIYKDARNRDQQEYRLPKDLTLTLIAGYNVKLRKRIIDRWLELERFDASSHIPGTQIDLLAEYAERTNAELVNSRKLTLKEIVGIRGAILHYIKVNVLEYINLRFRAMYERDRMLLGHAADTTTEIKAIRADQQAILDLALDAMHPEAFIRPEWCDVDDVYVLVGVGPVIPRRRSLSATIQRALDAHCKLAGKQMDMRTWRHGGRQASYWRKATVEEWLRQAGRALIRAHCAKYADRTDGVLPFRRPD